MFKFLFAFPIFVKMYIEMHQLVNFPTGFKLFVKTISHVAIFCSLILHRRWHRLIVKMLKYSKNIPIEKRFQRELKMSTRFYYQD